MTSPDGQAQRPPNSSGSHLIAPIHILVADRYVLLWLVGPCLGIAMAIEQVRGTLRLAASGTLSCVLAIACVRAQQAWTSSFELFSRGCDVNPRDPQMCENLSGELERAGAIDDALAAAARGLAAYPREPHIEMRVAQILWERGDREGALAAAQLGAQSGLSSAAMCRATASPGTATARPTSTTSRASWRSTR